MASPTQHVSVEQTLGDGKGQGSPGCCYPWGHRVGHDLVTEQEPRSRNKTNFSFFHSFIYPIVLPSLSLSPFKELYLSPYMSAGGFLCSSAGKGLAAMQETQFRSLGREDPLEKEMATHSSILVWRIPWTEKPGGLQSMALLGVWIRELEMVRDPVFCAVLSHSVVSDPLRLHGL